MDYPGQYLRWPCQGLVLDSQPMANLCDICSLEFATPAALEAVRGNVESQRLELRESL